MRWLFAAAVVMSATAGAAADPYRWCSEGLAGCGTSNCYFITLDQCRAASSGAGGTCTPNPFYTGPQEHGPRMSKRRDKGVS
jgi:hypothetical protein